MRYRRRDVPPRGHISLWRLLRLANQSLSWTTKYSEVLVPQVVGLPYAAPLLEDFEQGMEGPLARRRTSTVAGFTTHRSPAADQPEHLVEGSWSNYLGRTWVGLRVSSGRVSLEDELIWWPLDGSRRNGREPD
jgi:hypothetical protein